MSTDTYKKEIGMMNLEKLIEARESIPEVTFPIPDEELLKRFEQLYTGAVNDVLREFCLLDQALPHRIQPLREYQTVAGFAFTVKSAPNVKLTGEMEYRTQMLDEMKPNAFVLWDTISDEIDRICAAQTASALAVMQANGDILWQESDGFGRVIGQDGEEQGVRLSMLLKHRVRFPVPP